MDIAIITNSKGKKYHTPTRDCVMIVCEFLDKKLPLYYNFDIIVYKLMMAGF